MTDAMHGSRPPGVKETEHEAGTLNADRANQRWANRHIPKPRPG
jgi:hypothetical protein